MKKQSVNEKTLFQELQSKYEGTLEELIDLRIERDNIRGQNERAQSEISRLNDRNNELDANYSRTQKELTDKDYELTEAQNRISDLQGEIRGLKYDKDSLNSQVSRLENELDYEKNSPHY
jgi:chromosome segregation ATPase